MIGIDRSGRWLPIEDPDLLVKAENSTLSRLSQSNKVITFAPQSNGRISALSGYVGHEESEQIDVAFPILHGPMGEDGTVQGLLKLANIPFVGASVLGSAVGMDKDVMKRLLRDAGIPIARFITLDDGDEVPSFASVVEQLGLPVFVKPANMGSSVGVEKVVDPRSYAMALKAAFSFDLKILIEEFVDGREIECAVLGDKKPIASVLGEIKPNHEFYSYEAKYIDDDGAILEIPARLPKDTVRRAQEISIKTFKALSCQGLGRVDMFLREDGSIVVNEINTMPGFTRISMYPKLWAASGIPYGELIDRLIQLALERFDREKGLKTEYVRSGRRVE